MFSNSKFYMIMIILTFLILCAGVSFQVLEMKEYNLFETMQSRLFKGGK